jgi:hypothetical protein
MPGLGAWVLYPVPQVRVWLHIQTERKGSQDLIGRCAMAGVE